LRVWRRSEADQFRRSDYRCVAFVIDRRDKASDDYRCVAFGYDSRNKPGGDCRSRDGD